MNQTMLPIIQGLIEDLEIDKYYSNHKDIAMTSVEDYHGIESIIYSVNRHLNEEEVRELALDELKEYLRSRYPVGEEYKIFTTEEVTEWLEEASDKLPF